MIYPEGDAIRERVHNRYSLVVLAAKRAKQLKDNAPPLIDTTSTNPLTIALEEIAAGKVTYIEMPEPVVDDEAGQDGDTRYASMTESEDFLAVSTAPPVSQGPPAGTIPAELAAFLPIGQDADADDNGDEPDENEVDEADDPQEPEKAQS